MKKEKKDKVIIFQTTEEERKVIESKVREFKFSSMSEYLRFVSLNCKSIEINW
jgi:hypothetical protein